MLQAAILDSGKDSRKVEIKIDHIAINFYFTV